MLSVVIPAYNEEKYIGACLEALTRQDTKELFEVIVVDNASTDRTGDMTRRFVGKLDLQVIREKRKGRGAARAAGCKIARGDILFWTDADCLPPPTWISVLTRTLREQPTFVGVTTPLEIRDCTKFQNAILNLQWLLMRFYGLFWGHFWLNGFSSAIHRNIYEAAGGFAENALAQEDSELSQRVHRLGRIALLHEPRMPASGRRFQKSGLLRGLWAYLSFFIIARLSRGTRRATLSDVR